MGNLVGKSEVYLVVTYVLNLADSTGKVDTGLGFVCLEPCQGQTRG